MERHSDSVSETSDDNGHTERERQAQDEHEWKAMLLEAVVRLIQLDSCRQQCLHGKAAKLELFVCNAAYFTPSEKRLCIMTSLSILYEADSAQPARSRSTGARTRFSYYVPFVGKVCKDSFLNCFNVSASTVARYRAKITSGDLVYGSD